MDDYTTMFGSIIENSLDFVVTKETSCDDGWLESLNLSSSAHLDFSPSYLNSSDIYMPCFDPNLCPEEADMKPLDDYCEVFDDRLVQAIEYLNERCITVSELLVQLWVPVIRHGKQVLTTENKPFMVNSDSTSLSNYREVSKSYQFAVEFDSSEIIGLPSYVFLKKFPTCIPNLQFVAEANDPRVSYAEKLHLVGCLNFPVFELRGGACLLGVVEVVTTSQKVNFHGELENICKALEAVDLRTSDFLIHPKIKDFSEPCQVVLAEIRDVLRSICDTLKLPLAQTWGSCKDTSISIIQSASYVFDPEILGFYEACCDQQLVQGEGIAGKALGMNQPCFTANIADFCRADYPLAHQAKMFGLGGAVAIRLRSTYTGLMDFILEFFLPPDCIGHQEQTQMCSSITSMIQHISWSLHEISIDDEEAYFSVKETNTRDASWISHMLEAQQRGEKVIVSMGVDKEETEEEFKVINEIYQGPTFTAPGDQTYLEWGPDSRSQLSSAKRTTEKSRVKTERNISFQVLQQYFPGSLKDAAKSIGVCPTTLKRICRQHGIMRWPSRKIKKVSHSLKKLQLVIDSVQGAEGMFKLGSYYTNFPELSRPISLSPTTKVNNRVSLIKSQTTTTSNSSFSSCSHGSSSSLKSCGLQKRPCSNSSSTKNLFQEETKLLVRSEDNKLAEVIAPGWKSSSPISHDELVFRVKATFGEEKIRFKMSKEWSFGDLKREITRRFNKYDMEYMTVEYIDDDSDWVLLTCDADLEECMDLHISTNNQTIKLFLHWSPFVPMIHPNEDIHI